MIRLACPHCRATCKCPNHMAGQPSSCPRCRQSFTVPYQERPPEPIVVTGERTGRRAEEPVTGAPYSVAIGAMVLGAVSFPVSLIPLLGIVSLYISIPGLVLAVLSVFIMLWHRGRGIGFVLAACVLSTAAVVVGVKQYLAVEDINRGFRQLEKEWPARPPTR